jgi:cytochrome c biogenesis protein CcmG, thiol:disulfide interchange protein DsbE
VLASVGAVVGLLAYGFTTDPRAVPSTMVGNTAPDFSLALFDGRTVRLSDFRGKVVFLNFWSSWCPPCREEAPLLEAAWKRYQSRGVAFLGVAIQDTEEDARRFVRAFEITYPNGRDSNNRIAIDYGVYGIPETYFIDPNGRITAKYVGALSNTILAARLAEAARGIVGTEGKSKDYQSISVR